MKGRRDGENWRYKCHMWSGVIKGELIVNDYQKYDLMI